MRNNPRDWRIEDLKVVAARYEVLYRQQGTSHVVFPHPLAGGMSGLRSTNRHIDRGEVTEQALEQYPFQIRPLTWEEGGGYLIEFPDVPGCMSDGETAKEAIPNGRDALKCYLLTMKELGEPLPEPGSFKASSGQWRQRVPKSFHG